MPRSENSTSLKRGWAIKGAVLAAIVTGAFFGGRGTVSEPEVQLRWDRDAIQMLLDLGVTPDDFVRALQLELATGRPVDVMSLKMALELPPPMIELLRKHSLERHVFEDEGDQ